MEASTQAAAPAKHVKLDYEAIADFYNNKVQLMGSMSMDQVYNITLFKQRLERRGLVQDVDCRAWNRDGKTWVKKLTATPMTKG